MYLFAPFVLLSFSSVVQAASTPAHPGLSFPLTRRSNLRNREGVVHIEDLRRHIHHTTRKFGRAAGAGAISPFPLDKRDPSGDRVASSPLTPQDPRNNLDLWTGEMTIGATKMMFLPSTSRADLVVPGIECTQCGNMTQFYDPKKNCGKDLHKTVNETYDAGSTYVTGKLYEDSFSIAGLTGEDQKFVVATNLSDRDNSPRSLIGIFPLAYPSLSSIDAIPPFQTLIEQKQIAHAVFGVSLAPNCSELNLGGINPKYSDEDFVHLNVLGEEHNPGFWMVNLSGVSVHGVTGVNTIGPMTATLDTGTDFMLTSNRIAGDVYKHIPGSSYDGSGFYNIPCDFNKNVTLTFSADKHEFNHNILPRDFKFGVIANASSNIRCFGTIVGALEQDSMILGNAFLKQVYSKFDFEKNQVGFAPLRKC